MLIPVSWPWRILYLLLLNGLLLTTLHGMLLYFCKKLCPQTLSYHRRRFRLRKWERSGQIYRTVLKIHRWKDRMPQHIGRDGFSKATLDKTMTEDYVEQFLRETCRGEWYHTAALGNIPAVLFLNPLWLGSSLTLILLGVHGGCIVIQRYNRGRLLHVQNKKAVLSEKNTAIQFFQSSSEVIEPDKR